MPTIDEMMADLDEADAAGYTDVAQQIAERIKAARIQEMAPSHVPGEATNAPGYVESAGRGTVQGATLGWGDEAAAAFDALVPPVSRAVNPDVLSGAPEGAGFGDRYAAARDYYRAKNEAAQVANPKTYLAGQVGGGVATSLAAGGPRLLNALAMGAGAGSGYSEADDATGLVRDTALGTGLSLLGHGTGQVLGKAVGAVGGRAAALAAFARARAGTQASKEVAEEIQSAIGKLGAETQKGSRYVENLMRLEASMTPAQRQLYAQLQARGVVPGLQQSVAQGTLEALPSQAGTIATREAELAALQQAAPAAVTKRATDLLTPQVKPDLKSFAKAYAEPVAWAYGANKIAEMAGADPEQRAQAALVAGLIGGRTRAGKALWTRATRPAHQLALAEGVQNVAAKAGPLAGALGRAAPAGLIPAVSHAESTNTSAESILSKARADRNLRSYADMLERAHQTGGPLAVAQLHKTFYEKDPSYRQAMQEK